jgi:hypothetical protein
MGRTSRAAAGGALAAMVLGGTDQVAFARQAESGSVDGSGGVTRPVRSRARVRTGNEMLATLIREGSERSQTFRALLTAIDATDGIVYLTVGRCGRLRARFLHQMTALRPTATPRLLYGNVVQIVPGVPRSSP